MEQQSGTAGNAETDGSGVAVLDRTFAIFNAFTADDDKLSLAELSRRTGLYKSTLLRLLSALEFGGFLRKRHDGRYAIGHQPLRLSALYLASFHAGSVIEPLLEQLSRDLGETASLYVRQRDKRLVLYRVEPARAVRVSVRVGEEFAVDKGASGKVLLAFTEQLDARWHSVRQQLWAISHGERDPETTAVSAPVFGADDEFVGALTISGPRARFDMDATVTLALKTLLHAARQATASLGGTAARFDASIEALTESARAGTSA